MKNYDITLNKLQGDSHKWFKSFRWKTKDCFTTERWDVKKGKAYTALFEIFLWNHHFAIWKWRKPKERLPRNTDDFSCRIAYPGRVFDANNPEQNEFPIEDCDSLKFTRKMTIEEAAEKYDLTDEQIKQLKDAKSAT